MYFIRFFLALFLGASSVCAAPQDYPPTFFQLAQIHHFALNQDLITFKMPTARDRGSAESRLYEVKRDLDIDLITDVDAYVMGLITNPSEAKPEEWHEAVGKIMSSLKGAGKENIYSCFDEEGCQEVILAAILKEQEALKVNEVILWRATRDTPADESKNEDEFLSFSHGLFSGFIFDGYVYQYCEYQDWHACTYIYLSSFLRCKRRMEEGLVELRKGDVRFRPKGASPLYLYGVKLKPGALEEIRVESENDWHKKEVKEKRGNFMKPHHSVYGRGELFHPKLYFPKEAERVAIYSQEGAF